MKKLILSMIAVIAMSTTVFAQDENAGQRPQRMDPTEMIKKRTEEMVSTYKLTDEQATKVQALNEKFFKNMGPRGGRPGKGGPRGEKPDSLKMKPGKADGNTSASAKGEKKMEKGERPEGGRHGGPDFTEYNTELQKILTEEQYKAYQADMEKRREEMKNRRGQGGPRE